MTKRSLFNEFVRVLFIFVQGCSAFQANWLASRPRPARRWIARPEAASPWAVYDGCFSSHAIELIKQELFKNDKENGLMEETRVIDRHKHSAKLNCVETALVSWVDAMGEPGRFVEWWWRDEWVDMEAHKDVAEAAAVKGRARSLRYPTTAHVLYLSVDAEVRGPTCVWDQPHGTVSRVAVVPAVAGRVLQFRGDLLHSVPRPSLRYVVPSVDEIAFYLPEEIPDDAFNGPPGEDATVEVDDEIIHKEIPDGLDFLEIDLDKEDFIDEFDITRRIVVLFNTWEESPTELPSKLIPEEGASSHEEQLSTQCRKRHEWVDVQIEEVTSRSSQSQLAQMAVDYTILVVPLLGDRFRRGRDDNAIVLASELSKETVEAAMLSSSIPRVFNVRETSYLKDGSFD